MGSSLRTYRISLSLPPFTAVATLLAVRVFQDQKRGMRARPPLPGAPGITRGFIGSRPSRCSSLRASLRARRIASAAPWLPIGRNEGFGTSPFFGQLFKQVSAYLPQMGVPEIKSNRSHPLLCRRVADLVDHDCVRSATALRELTVSPAILIWQRLVHLFRV
jgi:hypothetical protein